MKIESYKDKSFFGKIVLWIHRHPVFFNFLVIFFVMVLTVVILNAFIKKLTRHGETVDVPSVTGLYVDEAIRHIKSFDLELRVDSVYNPSVKGGTVINQSPDAGLSVKEGRLITIVYARYTAPDKIVPRYTNVSASDAVARFRNSGFENVSVVETISATPGKVISVTNGKTGNVIIEGSKIAANTPIEIEIGIADPTIRDNMFEDEIIPGESGEYDDYNVTTDDTPYFDPNDF